jgi:tetratricopeptide (TPR) repeat protein
VATDNHRGGLSVRRSIPFLAFLVISSAQLHAQSRGGKIDALLQKYFEYDQFTGSVLVADEGKIILEKGYGFANQEWEIHNAPDTKFRLGSIAGVLYDKPYAGPRQSIAHTEEYSLDEGEMNGLGYQLLQEGKTKESIEVFKLNVAAFPKSWNVYDSLGEAYMNDGDKRLAIVNYEKSLEMNGSNKGAVEALKKLKGAP